MGKYLIQMIDIPKSIVQSNGVAKIDLHVFCGSSKIGSCAVEYIGPHHPGSSSQGLIASKSRLAKQNTEIPCLELIASHMASNLAQNLNIIIGNGKIAWKHWPNQPFFLYNLCSRNY